MKSSILIIRILIAAFTINTTAQNLVKCGDRTAFWLIPEDDYYYCIKLQGDIDLSSQQDILNIDEKALQVVVLNKKQYISKDNNDQNLLLRYIAGESDYLQNKFRDNNLNLYYETLELSSGKTAVFWYFEYPEGKNEQVTAQLFVNIVINDRIFGLGTPQFTGMDFESLRIFLLEGISNTSIIKNTESLCNK